MSWESLGGTVREKPERLLEVWRESGAVDFDKWQRV